MASWGGGGVGGSGVDEAQFLYQEFSQDFDLLITQMCISRKESFKSILLPNIG